MRIFGQLLLVDKQKLPYLYRTTSISQTIPAAIVFIPNDATKFTFQNTEIYVFF